MRYLNAVLSIVIVHFLVLFVGCPLQSTGPEADFSANIVSGHAPVAVHFTDCSLPGNSPIASWLWLFGDGGESTEQDPSHTYSTPGTYNVSLTITTPLGDDTELKLNYISVVPGGEGLGEGETTLMLPGDLPLEMVWCPAGTFIMGSPSDEHNRFSDEGPRHRVTLTRGFWMGKYEVTQAQWYSVMEIPPYALIYPTRPAAARSWNDCQEFLSELNALDVGTFRLPTEAEWEYAYRAGTTTRFFWGKDSGCSEIDDYAWYDANSGFPTHPVGEKRPNVWGLYDMSGNVSEWCQDWKGNYTSKAVSDPQGPSSGEWRIRRGSSASGPCSYSRAAWRYGYGYPDYCGSDVGLRLVWAP